MWQFLNNPWLLATALIVGLIVLVKGADWLVDGASAIAKRFGTSDLIIGLTVVAFGTSMPEFVVNMVSVADGATELAITNVLGSNIINIFVILGLTAVVRPVVSQRMSRMVDIPVATLAGVLVLVFAWSGGIGRWEAIILLAIFVGYMFFTLYYSKRQPVENEETVAPMQLWKAILLVLVGLAGLEN